MNRILNVQLIIYAAKSVEEIEDWDRFIPEMQRKINVSINRSTGRSPFELLHGYIPRFNESALPRIILKTETVNDLDIMREIAHQQIAKSQDKMQIEFNKRHCAADKLQVGEIVFIRVPNTLKLGPRYRGPMVVVENIAGDIYRIQDLRREGTQTGQVDLHISQIRAWKSTFDDFDSESESSDADGEEDLTPRQDSRL